MNSTVLIGRLAANPELKEIENGKKVLNITLAIDRSYKNSKGIYETDFIKCSLWNGIAENVNAYCKIGDLLGLRGHLQEKENTTGNKKQTELIFVADKVTFLASTKNKENSDEKNVNLQ